MKIRSTIYQLWYIGEQRESVTRIGQHNQHHERKQPGGNRVDIYWDDYKNAKKRGLDRDLHAKVEKLKDSTLEYGDALLDNDKLDKAMQNYRELWSLDDLDESQRAVVNPKITNALYIYSDRMRREQHEQHWDRPGEPWSS